MILIFKNVKQWSANSLLKIIDVVFQPSISENDASQKPGNDLNRLNPMIPGESGVKHLYSLHGSAV